MALLQEAFNQVVVSLMILGIGTWIFCLVNRWRSIPTEKIDPHTGERVQAVRWERGTRRSRWRGYCVIGGAVLGNQAIGIVVLIAAARSGNTAGVSMAVAETGPCGMTVGLLAGLVVGAFSSRFVPEHSRPPDPDAG